MTDVDSDLPPMSKSELHQEVMRYRRRQKDAIPKLAELRKQEATLRAERDELREALELYADPRNVGGDGGNRARAALNRGDTE